MKTLGININFTLFLNIKIKGLEGACMISFLVLLIFSEGEDAPRPPHKLPLNRLSIGYEVLASRQFLAERTFFLV